MQRAMRHMQRAHELLNFGMNDLHASIETGHDHCSEGVVVKGKKLKGSNSPRQ